MRRWHNVSVNGYYTLSKTMSQRAAAQQHDAGRARRTTASSADEYGRADTDQRHVFSTSVNWELDYYDGDNGFWRGLLNGWSISPIIKLRSGLPFTITNGNVDANLDGQTNDRAQQVGDPADRQPDAGRSGSIPPRSCRTGSSPAWPPTATRRATCSTGPGSRSSTWRSRAISSCPGTSTLTFRAEATNAFNIVNYGQPGNSVPSGATSTTFGVIRTANAMRRLQLGVRWTF